MARAPRFLLYSHDAFGFGHTRRNLAIAAAIRARHSDAPILVATSIREASRLGLPEGTELIYLPSIKKLRTSRTQRAILPSLRRTYCACVLPSCWLP